MAYAIALQLHQKKPAGKLPRIPKRILDGREPIAQLYTGKWKPVSITTQSITLEDLEKTTQAADEAMAEAFAGMTGTQTVPLPAASLPKAKPTSSKSLTPAQQRLWDCWQILRQAPRSATNAELCEYYHQAGLKPRKSWRVPSYLDVPGNSNLEACFRKEKSDARQLPKRLRKN